MSHLRSTSHTLGDEDFPYIYKKGPAFGMPGVRVDGMDVLKVWPGTHSGSLPILRCAFCARICSFSADAPAPSCSNANSPARMVHFRT